nr:MAG TPA: hypothetical protein [Caudoviricetes sp.]
MAPLEDGRSEIITVPIIPKSNPLRKDLLQ